MDSLPGAGAEILVDRVRRLVSNGKCGAEEWLEVMADSTSIAYYNKCNHDVWSC
jgi:2-iminoacetate synthase ThiH